MNERYTWVSETPPWWDLRREDNTALICCKNEKRDCTYFYIKLDDSGYTAIQHTAPFASEDEMKRTLETLWRMGVL